MIDREVNELLKDATIYADIRWVPHRERLSEMSGRYLMSIKNDYEQTHSKPALSPADVVPVVHSRWIKTADGAECEKCGREAVYQIVDNYWQYEPFCPHCGAIMDNKRGNENG